MRRATIFCTLQVPSGLWFRVCSAHGFDIFTGASLNPWRRESRRDA